jgi:hypothetical protein
MQPQLPSIDLQHCLILALLERSPRHDAVAVEVLRQHSLGLPRERALTRLSATLRDLCKATPIQPSGDDLIAVSGYLLAS